MSWKELTQGSQSGGSVAVAVMPSVVSRVRPPGDSGGRTYGTTDASGVEHAVTGDQSHDLIPRLTRRTSSRREEQEDLIDSHPFLCLEGWVVKRLRAAEAGCMTMDIPSFPIEWQGQLREGKGGLYVTKL